MSMGIGQGKEEIQLTDGFPLFYFQEKRGAVVILFQERNLLCKILAEYIPKDKIVVKELVKG